MNTLTRLLLGKPVSEQLLGEARALIAARPAGTSPPTLASVHVGSGGPFAFYLRQQQRSAQSVGMNFREVSLPADSTTAMVREQMRTLENDATVHAVLLQHPLPPGVEFQPCADELSPEKDVDGVGSVNLGRLVEGRATHAPAVALGVLNLLRFYSIPTRSERVAVIGRSPTVGLPLALLLAGHGEVGDATVTVAHSRTQQLREVLADQRIIVSCAGVPGLLSRTVVPEGSVVIDVGLSSVADLSSPSGMRAAGDADGGQLDGWAEAWTPVPGGVGPVTAAQLMRNAVEAWSLITGGGR